MQEVSKFEKLNNTYYKQFQMPVFITKSVKIILLVPIILFFELLISAVQKVFGARLYRILLREFSTKKRFFLRGCGSDPGVSETVENYSP